MIEKILALDLGSKTLGMASNDGLGIVHPLDVFHFPKDDYIQAAKKVIKVCEEKGITRLILGTPLHQDHSLSQRSRISEKFKATLLDLNKQLNIELINERLTSFEADEIMTELGIFKEKRKAIRDSIAALVLLENYLKGSF